MCWTYFHDRCLGKLFVASWAVNVNGYGNPALHEDIYWYTLCCIHEVYFYGPLFVLPLRGPV